MSITNEQIDFLAEEVYPQIIDIRHNIHQNPELSFHEFQTADLIEKTLTKFGVSYKRIPDTTAIVGTIEGKQQGSCIGIRADMDALPIQESTGISFQSQIPGVMHACGHDMHVANLLGTAYILDKLKEYWAGTIKLFFQPAEEVGGGAQEMLDFGVLEKPTVQACLAAHTDESLPVGKVKIKAEEVMLAFKNFTVEFTGKGGHGAAPHKAEDCILAAAGYIMDIQGIPGRAQNFLDPAIVTVGTISGGQVSNVLAQKTILKGSIRAQRKETLEKVMKKMQQILETRAQATGTKGSLRFAGGINAVYNDPALTQVLRQAATNILGSESIVSAKFPANGSENFAFFSEKVPSVFFHFGVKADEQSIAHPAHSPYFLASDDALLPTMKVMTKGALAFLEAMNKQ